MVKRALCVFFPNGIFQYVFDIFWIRGIDKYDERGEDGYKINLRVGKKIKKREMFLTKGPNYGRLYIIVDSKIQSFAVYMVRLFI